MTMHTSRSVFVSFFIALGIIGASVAVTHAQVAPPSTISYPIKELGSCKDKEACKSYCDKPANMQACIIFAEQKGILKGEDLRISKIVAARIASKKTPGSCTSKSSCEAYCNGSVEHLNECLAFGQELGVISPSDLAEAQKIANALKSGASMPGSCKTKDQCEKYCEVGAHIDECLAFAEASGILPANEIAEARKVAPFLKSGQTPGKCTTKDSCDAYCAADAHFDECLSFAEKAGFVSAEDAAVAKKTGGKGPGGCRGKAECEAFCNDESHASECFSFAKEKGLLTDEQKALVDMSEKFQPKDGAAGKPGTLPNIEDLKKNIPDSAPADVRARMEKEIENQMKNIPTGPQGDAAPTPRVPSRAPNGAPGVNQDLENPSAQMCASFASAPSCDYVPAGQPRDLCKKCKGQ